MVERGGNTLYSQIANPSPWTTQECGREGCMPCKAKPGSCKRANIVYRITCINCASEGRTRQYLGESHRTLWDRANDHMEALKRKDQKYGVVKHWTEEHQDSLEPPEYQFKLVSTHKSSLHRQIWEALEIEGADPSTLLNSKG